MGERHPPSARDCASQIVRLDLYRAQRVEIVSLVLWAFHMRAGGHDVHQMHEASAVALHLHNLMVSGVPVGHADVQSRHQLGVGLQWFWRDLQYSSRCITTPSSRKGSLQHARGPAPHDASAVSGMQMREQGGSRAAITLFPGSWWNCCEIAGVLFDRALDIRMRLEKRGELGVLR
jgi:hypothetical protein